jgi:serine/threonine-protein kinase
MQRIEPDTLVDSRYRIIRKLGSGGMADVYMAEDQQLGRRVALKVLHRRFAEDEQFVERFRREASSAAGLSHPNVVAIFDRGEWDGTYYISMELVEGRTLKDIVREKGPAPPEAAVDLTLQILRAARYAHKHGVVHRDIKPHNVLIDQDGRVRVTDFGIARAGSSDITETGSVMGTAQYLSPEQAQGRPVDERADLYAIGIVLYELLTGQVPFDAEQPVTVALKQVSELPVPPAELVHAIPPAIDAVVMRALEKDPDRRYQSADEFIAALDDARAAPQVVPPPPPVVVEEERDRSRWWLWLLIALALAAIAVGLYLTLRPEQLTVPNVIDRESATASQILQNRGFEVDIVPVVNPDVERDHVAAQDPRPNTEAPEGSTVTITVSSGPGEAAVPARRGRAGARGRRLPVARRARVLQRGPQRPRDRHLAAGRHHARARQRGHAERLARSRAGRGARRDRRQRGQRAQRAGGRRAARGQHHARGVRRGARHGDRAEPGGRRAG